MPSPNQKLNAALPGMQPNGSESASDSQESSAEEINASGSESLSVTDKSESDQLSESEHSQSDQSDDSQDESGPSSMVTESSSEGEDEIHADNGSETGSDHSGSYTGEDDHDDDQDVGSEVFASGPDNVIDDDDSGPKEQEQEVPSTVLPSPKNQIVEKPPKSQTGPPVAPQPLSLAGPVPRAVPQPESTDAVTKNVKFDETQTETQNYSVPVATKPLPKIPKLKKMKKFRQWRLQKVRAEKTP